MDEGDHAGGRREDPPRRVLEALRPNAGAPPRRGRFKLRGRQTEAEALAEIRELLGGRPRRRDLLIEFLHLVQDRHGWLSAAHLRALAEEMRLPQAEVYETATFYAHFDVVKEGETPPPPVTIRVCDSLPCAMQGSEALLAALASAVDPGAVRVVRAPCMGRCDGAPALQVGQRHIERASAAAALDAIEAGETGSVMPAWQGFDAYVAEGGYEALAACRRGARSLDEVLDALGRSGLQGLGGAGFPASRKWGLVRTGAAPRFLCVNADEGEPGTFKDRHHLERRPHQFLEGALIAAWGVEAERAYVYLRDEYPHIREILLAEIAALEARGLVPPGYLELRRGAGAYICGEESAMIESIEGKRGYPRLRPPYVAERGLFGRPTLVHNVETLYWMPPILRNGADWFAEQGRPGHKGLRSYSVSGRVRNPGLVLAPAGTTAAELVERCGGMEEGHRFAAYLPGGASGGILPAALADLPLDFGQLEKYGSFVGSHAVVILSDRDDPGAAALNLLRFFADESCGQCTPCRVGCEKAVRLMERGRWDEPLLRELSRAMTDASICGLGQAAGNPVLSVLNHFPGAAGGAAGEAQPAPRSPETPEAPAATRN